MARLLLLLLLMPALLRAQDAGEDDDEEIIVDGTPEGEEADAEPKPKTHPKREKGKRPGHVKISRKNYEFQFPDDWAARPFDAARGEFGYDIAMPGSTRDSRLILVHEEKFGPVRAAPRHFREWALKNYRGSTAETRLEPWPQLVVSTKDGGLDRRVMFLFLELKGNAFYFELTCPAEDFAQAETDLHAVADSFEAEVEWLPRAPKGYGVVEKKPFVFATHPELKRSIRDLQRVLKKELKSFTKVHGALPKTARLLVIVHETKEKARGLSPAAADANSDYYAELQARSIFAVPLAKEDLEARGFLASSARDLLLYVKYGDVGPAIFRRGETAVARAAAMTGKALPSLDEGFVGWLTGATIQTLDAVEAMDVNSPDIGKQAFFYGCAFHGGKYRKAYRAFLEEFAETADGEAAWKKHILSIDAGSLRDAVQDYMFNRIKPVKRK